MNLLLTPRRPMLEPCGFDRLVRVNLLAIVLSVVLVSCSTSSNRSGDGSSSGSSVRAKPVRVTWIDFSQRRRAAEAQKGGKRSRKIGISQLALVSRTFAQGKYAKDLEAGRLRQSIKVIDGPTVDQLLEAFDAEGFFDHSQAIFGASLASDPRVKAVITVEQDGVDPQTLVHTLGAGTVSEGRRIIESFARCKRIVLGTYNATTQFGHITIKRQP